MTSSRIFLYIAAIYLLGFFSHALYLHKTVYGDGIFYYSWLRSVVVDHDVNFANEYEHFGAAQPRTSAGVVGNKYSIGPALVWAPAFITAHQLVRSDGYSLPYQLAVGTTTVLAVIFALLLLYRLLEGSVATRLFIIMLIAGGTNLLFYGSLDAVNSHGVSFFVSVLYLSFLAAKKPNGIAVGASLALLSMMRLQDFIFVLLLWPIYKSLKWHHVFVGFLFAFLPQLVVWSALYGNFWTNPYLAGGENFALFRPHILGVLFYKDSGLFLWTPIVALGVWGLWTQRFRYKMYLILFLLELWLVATWSTWWQGASYSGRMFVSCLPLVAFGLSQGVNSLKKASGEQVMGIFVGSLCLLNGFSIIYFLLMH